MKHVFLKTIFFAAAVTLFAQMAHVAHAEGATLFFKAPVAPVGVGDEFLVPVLLDTGGQKVNTIAGDLVFSDSTLVLKRVATANSMVTAWIESPVISGNSVTFSGIMPGGYESVLDPLSNAYSPGIVITLVFQAKSAGRASLAFTDSHLYLNDGNGSEVGLVSLPYVFPVSFEGSGQVADAGDTLPPESFIPIVSASPDIYAGAYALYFGTTDKGTGIDHYEVSENHRGWVRAESPYLIVNQSLSGSLQVKAVDGAGNYRIEDVPGMKVFNRRLVLIPIGFFVLLLLFLAFIYKREMRKYKQQ